LNPEISPETLSYLQPQIYRQHLSLKEGFLRHEYNQKTNNGHRRLGNSLRKGTKNKGIIQVLVSQILTQRI